MAHILLFNIIVAYSLSLHCVLHVTRRALHKDHHNQGEDGEARLLFPRFAAMPWLLFLFAVVVSAHHVPFRLSINSSHSNSI